LIYHFSEWEYARNGRRAPYTPWPERQNREDYSAAVVHTVFSCSGSLYQRWQADLLAYSHRKVRQPGPLSRLLSAHEQPPPFAGRTFRTKPYSPHPLTGDDYSPYNKPKALQDWLREAPPTEAAVLILDPDCIFSKPLVGSVSRGHPIAQPMSYLDPKHDHNLELVEKHCANPELVDGVGIPILIHRDDLAAVVPLWLKKTEEIRDNPKSRELAGWVAEMWAYAFATADLGLRHTTRELARVSTEDRADLPIVHYCYSLSDAEGHWAWDKRGYRPWERVSDPPDNIPLASKALISLLNEWIAMPEHQICLFEA
jgi:hydroxyproline O-arabinosyltransferase